MSRIVMFGPGHAEAGGAARRSRLLAAGLVDRGFEVRAVTRAGTLRRFRRERSEGLHVIEVPGFGSPKLGGLLYLACAVPLGLLWGTRARCLLAIQLYSQASAAALCSLLLRRPFVAMTTTSGRFSEARHVREARPAWLRRRLIGRAASLVAQTPTGAAELETIVARERVEVIPNPVEAVDPPPLDGLPRVLFSGRLSDEKDLPRLLEAWRVVRAELPDARLALVGEGGHYRSVEEELRATVAGDPVLSESVSFAGWVEDVAAHIAGADVYAFPSLDEGMSNSLLEACAWRRVVVASDIGPNRAVLGEDHPLLYPAGDTDALAAALLRALTDEDARAAALANVDERLPRFSPDAVVGRLEEVIDAASRTRDLDA